MKFNEKRLEVIECNGVSKITRGSHNVRLKGLGDVVYTVSGKTYGRSFFLFNTEEIKGTGFVKRTFLAVKSMIGQRGNA